MFVAVIAIVFASRSASAIVLITLALWSTVESAPVEVRFLIGVTHGFLVLRSTTGQIVAQRDLLQTTHPDRVESRMVGASGELALSADVYNGMTVMILKNVARGRSASVHCVAFTPKPRLIKLDLVPAGDQSSLAGKGTGRL